MFEASATHTGCSHRPLVKSGEQGRFVTPMSLHQPAVQAFLLAVVRWIGRRFRIAQLSLFERLISKQLVSLWLFGLLMDVEETVELTLASLASRRSRFLR